MSAIENLRRQIDGVSRMITTYEESGTDGRSIARDLSMVSFRQHLGELREQLATELTLREKEIIEVALADGEPGTISLRLLAKFAGSFGQAVHQAGRFIQHGTVRGPVPQDIADAMDLRLADLKAASTHLYITGKTAPDLFGRSLVEDSLTETFAVLKAESAEDLTDAVATVGYSAASAIKRMLREVARVNQTLEIRWRTPEEREVEWRGDPEAMRRLADSLEAFSREEPREIDVEGTVITVSLREPFLIETDHGDSFAAAVSTDAMPQVQAITVGVRARAKLLRNIIRNKTTGREKVTYTLLGLTSL